MPDCQRFRGRRCVLVAVILAGGVARAADTPAAKPDETPVAVVADAKAAQAALDQARAAGRAVVADLSLGHEGKIVRSQTAGLLSPGRYRLHALVASTSHDQLLGEAVALRLAAGGSRNVFELHRWFREPGKLAAVNMDVVVDKPGAITVAADWLVGDSKLDRNQHGELAAARKAYLDRRQNALNLLGIRGGPEMSLRGSPSDDIDLDDLLRDGVPRLKPRAIAGTDLPPHRLMITGLVVERMSPVSLVTLGTDAPAYEPGDIGRVTAELRNLAGEPVTLKLSWAVEDDSRPGEILAQHEETVALAAGERRVHALADPLATAGIQRLGWVRMEAAAEGLRADATRAPFVVLPARKPPMAAERPKKVFAHYMGCYPVGTGVTRNSVLTAGESMHHDRGDDVSRRGGRFRNFPLVPQEPALTAEQSADLEIRRAMRIGIDGFAVDAWAGGQGAKDVLDTLFKVAEEKDYPFELTICLDDAGPGDIISLLEKHGGSPKLARRDGKPLIFSYFSHGKAMGALFAAIDERIPDSERAAAVNRLRATELGWHLIGQSFRSAEETVGRPVSFHYDLVYFFHEVPRELVRPGMMTRAAAAIARHVSAVGSFGTYGLGYGDRTQDIARVVREAGAEWSGPGGMHQKENLLPGGGEVFMPRGTEWLRDVWAGMIRDEASLLQLVTWNDYTENTNIAPAYNTRYTIYDLTGYFIGWWRDGRPPATDRDRVYLTYAKYPKDAKAWPFRIGMRSDRGLEVLTILTGPATVRLPGRDIQYEAPGGLHAAQFPVAPGPVIAEVVRDGRVTERLESPEPIVDRPFREDNAMVCYSTEFVRHWRADFGDSPQLSYSDYGDADGDGLPNWFEMYWFSKERGFKPVVSDDPDEFLNGPNQHPITRWLDLSTVTRVDPDADPDADGKTNLDEFQNRTDPTVPALVPTGP